MTGHEEMWRNDLQDGRLVCAESGKPGKWPHLRAEHLLSLAAAPIFAVMALLAAVHDGSKDTTCSGQHEASPLSGMVAMYVLMSIVHAAPWLRVIRRRQGLLE